MIGKYKLSMNTLNEALQALNDNIIIVTTIITSAGALVASFMKVYVSNRKILSRFETLATHRDKQMETLISDIKPLIEYQRQKMYLKEIRAVIQMNGDTSLANCKNEDFYQIAVDGMDSAFEFFERIYKDGFETIDQKQLQFRALNSLSKIRSAHLVNGGVTPESADRIKLVAQKNLGNLIRELMQLKTGFYNGHAELQYKEIIGRFIYNFLNDSYRNF